MMLSGIAYQQQPLAPLTGGIGSGLLPTPEASNTKAVALRSGGRLPRNYLGPLWPTPTTDSATDRSSRYAQGGMPLALAVKLEPTNAFKLGMTQKPTHSIPTPTASDHIERECTSTEALNFETNKSVTLDRWVKMWPTPSASDDRDRGCLKTPAIKRRHAAGKQLMLSMVVSEESGQLNPQWVEWLMGFPPGWTEPMKAGKPSRKTRPA
jgi:hypothetical protein